MHFLKSHCHHFHCGLKCRGWETPDKDAVSKRALFLRKTDKFDPKRVFEERGGGLTWTGTCVGGGTHNGSIVMGAP